MTYETAYEILADTLCIDTDALDLAFAIGGCNIETAERILFYYTGWKTFEGFLTQEDE